MYFYESMNSNWKPKFKIQNTCTIRLLFLNCGNIQIWIIVLWTKPNNQTSLDFSNCEIYIS